VTDADGFELAFHTTTPSPSEHWHFGFTFEHRAEVAELRAALEAAGVALVDVHDTAEYVGFKCRDPDSYWIEVYHEPRG
jgi:hypothetical protein